MKCLCLFNKVILAPGNKQQQKKYASRLLHTAYLTDISHPSWPKNISLDYQVSLPKTNACLVNKALLDIAVRATKQMSHSMCPLTVCQKFISYSFINETIYTQ